MPQMYIVLHVKNPLILSYFNNILIFSTNFQKTKSSDAKIYENQSSDSRADPCGQTD